MYRSADLMVMVSSISSTPSRSLFANMGGTASTTDARTERNSLSAFSLSFPLWLRALLGESSGFMGALACRPRTRIGCPDRDDFDIPGNIPGNLTCHPTQLYVSFSFSFSVQNGACHVSHVAQLKQILLIITVGPKTYHPNPRDRNANIRESSVGGHTASRQKYVRSWSSGIGLTAFLFHADAKHRPQGAIGSDVAGVGNATTGSVTDKLTREHRMTIDEAHLILNAKRGENLEQILRVCPLLRGCSGTKCAISDDLIFPLELRAPIQGKRSTRSAAAESRIKCSGYGNTSAFALPAVKGSTRARTNRSGIEDRHRGATK